MLQTHQKDKKRPEAKNSNKYQRYNNRGQEKKDIASRTEYHLTRQLEDAFEYKAVENYTKSLKEIRYMHNTIENILYI